MDDWWIWILFVQPHIKKMEKKEQPKLPEIKPYDPNWVPDASIQPYVPKQ